MYPVAFFQVLERGRIPRSSWSEETKLSFRERTLSLLSECGSSEECHFETVTAGIREEKMPGDQGWMEMIRRSPGLIDAVSVGNWSGTVERPCTLGNDSPIVYCAWWMSPLSPSSLPFCLPNASDPSACSKAVLGHAPF